MSTTRPRPAVDDPYSSRVGSQWEAVARQDPVVWGTDSGPLDPAAVERYAQQGFFAIPALFTPQEATEFREYAEHLAQMANPDAEHVISEPDDDRTVRSIFRVHRDGGLFEQLCRDPRLVGLAQQLLGSDVYVHQSRINFKPALNGKEFFWHSDFETWHVEDGMPRMRAVSISINLTENTEFNGPLMVIPRSHELFIRCAGYTPEDHYRQSLKRQQYGVPSREALQLLFERGGGIAAPKGVPGSALVFECNTMHGSVGNLSPYPRTNLFLVYNSVENRVGAPFGNQPPRPVFLAEREIEPLSV